MTARTHHLTALLLSACLAGPAAADAVPQATRDARHVPDLALMSYADARAAEGHRGLFLVKPWLVRVEGTWWVLETLGPDDALGTAYVPLGKWRGAARAVVVEAELRLVWHPRSADGVTPGFWEYRLVDAAVVESREK